jgi:sugar O-acyltransferase (sialic acid O-acetyltransferase NeuD family)
LNQLVILGCGGHARETCLHVLDTFPSADIVFYDNFSKSAEVIIKKKAFCVYSDLEQIKKNGFTEFIVGVGLPKVKQKLVKEALESGLSPASTIIHPSAVVQDANVGKGGLIAPGVVVTTSVTLGDFVILNYNCTVGHDSKIGNFTTCNPGSNISGNCLLGESIYFGVGAAVREGLSICNHVTIGGKAFVTKSISEENSTWIGLPAKKV